jgi:hypothetical protein
MPSNAYAVKGISLIFLGSFDRRWRPVTRSFKRFPSSASPCYFPKPFVKPLAMRPIVYLVLGVVLPFVFAAYVLVKLGCC